MDQLGDLINGVLILAVGIALWLLLRGRLEAIDRRIERLEDSVNALRSDLTQVALAIGARPPAEAG